MLAIAFAIFETLILKVRKATGKDGSPGLMLFHAGHPAQSVDRAGIHDWFTGIDCRARENLASWNRLSLTVCCANI